MEKAGLEEALGLREDSEQHLVLELEGLRLQLQQEAQAHAALKEGYAVLQGLKEEREAGKNSRGLECGHHWPSFWEYKETGCVKHRLR